MIKRPPPKPAPSYRRNENKWYTPIKVSAVYQPLSNMLFHHALINVYVPHESGPSGCCVGVAAAAVRPSLPHASHLCRQGTSMKHTWKFSRLKRMQNFPAWFDVFGNVSWSREDCVDELEESEWENVGTFKVVFSSGRFLVKFVTFQDPKTEYLAALQHVPWISCIQTQLDARSLLRWELQLDRDATSDHRIWCKIHQLHKLTHWNPTVVWSRPHVLIMWLCLNTASLPTNPKTCLDLWAVRIELILENIKTNMKPKSNICGWWMDSVTSCQLLAS